MKVLLHGSSSGDRSPATARSKSAPRMSRSCKASMLAHKHTNADKSKKAMGPLPKCRASHHLERHLPDGLVDVKRAPLLGRQRDARQQQIRRLVHERRVRLQAARQDASALTS